MENIKKLPIWLLWKKEIRNEKPTKVPYKSPNVFASSTDPSTWSSYYDLQSRYFSTQPKDQNRGIGIVFEDTANVFGIDFDHCVDESGIHPEVAEFVKQANTYTEYSPSGTGLHLLFRKTEPIELLANKHHFDTYAIEVYTSGRYFTFTENVLPDHTELRDINESELTDLLETLGYPWRKLEVAPVYQVGAPTLEDQKVLDKMFNSKAGQSLKRLYDNDITEEANDHSKADHKLCWHLAFWTGKNYDQIERIWLRSPLGQRKKTQDRADYRQRTITNAIASQSEVYTPVRTMVSKVTHQEETGEEIDFDFILSGGKDPQPQLILPNISRVLRKDPYFKNTIRKNDFSHMVETLEKNEWVSLNDDFIGRVREYISENYPYFVKLSKDMTTDAILLVACDNRVNPPKDYFTSLVWDNTPRINSWLHHAYGTPDDELHQAIGSNWLKGLVKRVMQPGCQFDEVLALESPQGYRKSTSLRVLGSPWHVETTHSIDNKDFYLLLAQNIIVEFSEGEIMDRASVNKLKAEITKTEDQLRPPYERGMVKFKRSCVFAVTTNRLELKDDTGNRRWLPVQLEKVADIDWLKENKDQLFAEAYYRVIILGETTHEYPDSLRDLQESRQEYGDADEKLMDHFALFTTEALLEEGVTLEQVGQVIYGQNMVMDRLKELLVSSVLRRLHFYNKRCYVKGKRVRRWVPDEKGVALIESIKKYNDQF